MRSSRPGSAAIPSLNPETSQQWTAGFIFEPVSSLSLGAEYWWIKVKNMIGLPPEAPIFDDMVAAEAAGLLFRFAPGSPGCPASATAGGIPCPVYFRRPGPGEYLTGYDVGN